MDTKVRFVIEKLVGELNAHTNEGCGGYIELYDDEIDEINTAITELGIDVQLPIVRGEY